MPSSIELSTLGVLFGGYLIHLYVKHRRIVSSFYPVSGPVVIFDEHSIPTRILPRIPGVSLGGEWYRENGYQWFKKTGYDVIATFGFIPHTRAVLRIADAELIKEITTAHFKFLKPIEDYEILSMFGSNVVITDGKEWKRHRRIVAPAFGESTNKLAWNEAVLVMQGLFSKWDRQSDTGQHPIMVNHGVDITMPMALMVMSAAGFGNRLSWDDDLPPSGHAMSFKRALHIVSSQLIWGLIIPSWLPSLTTNMAEVRTGFAELKVYMTSMIEERKFALQKNQLDGSDILTLLYHSSEQGQVQDDEVDGTDKNATSSIMKLTDEELIGNIFLFLIAGHETTSHTLCFALAFLALYPDVQRKLHKHVLENVQDTDNPVYSEMTKLPYALAIIQETLRLMPPVGSIPKIVSQDTTIRVRRSSGSNDEYVPVFIPKGTALDISTAGIHHNPRYWKNPEEFNPDRFLGEWNRDAFLPFSAGPRACLGRRFSETESVVFLSMLVARYEISIQDEPQFRGETFEQKRRRVFEARTGITTTPVRVPLMFKRRDFEPHRDV